MKSLSLGGIDNRLRWMFGVSALMIMVLVASLALRQTGSYYTPVDGWGVDLFELAMGVLCLRRYFNPSWRSSSSTARAIPLVLGGACIVWGLGDTVLTFESLWGATPAVPSAADGFYLAFFPLCYIAFMMVIRRGKGASPFATSLDGLIAGLGAASISAAFVFAPVLRAAGGSNLSAATTMAYPVGDLLLLCLAVGGLAVLPRRYRRFFWVASVAMSSNATGDLFSLLEPNSKVGYIANAVAWPISLLLLAMATWLLPVNAEKVGAEKSGGFALPLLGAVGSMVILFLASVGHVGRVAVGLATATLLVAAVRLILTVRRAQALNSARFGSLIDNAWDIIVVAEADLAIAYITPSSERVLGYVPEDLRDRPLPELVHPDDTESMTAHLNGLRNEHIATVAFETRVRHREGEWRRIAWTATDRLDDPAVRGYVLNGGDVTEERHAAEDLVAARDGAMMASKAKSEFLSTMSHEIRTPMNGVIGLTELLLGTSLDPDQQELASGVKVSAENLLVIINGILDFSKIEAGQLDLEEAPLSVAGIADDVGRILAGAAHGKGVELLVDVHPDVPSALLGDSVRIQQVLLNLGSNAVKFTPEGEVVIRVLVLDENSDRVALRFEVVDEGIGIATTDQVRLFRPFAQADSSTTRRFGGTGLGLAICRQLVELMGGKLGLVSTPAEGSTFWFELSLARAASERSCGTGADTPSLASRSALIVDDNATNRTILRQQLRSWGVEAVEAADGYEAIGIATAAAQAGEIFDVGVLDLNMPGMDGVELAKLLKAESGHHDDDPVPPQLLGGAARRSRVSLAWFRRQPDQAGPLLGALRLLDQRAQRRRAPDPVDHLQKGSNRRGAGNGHDPARGGQRDEPAGGLESARQAGLQLRHRQQRPGGGHGHGHGRLRRCTHGLRDA